MKNNLFLITFLCLISSVHEICSAAHTFDELFAFVTKKHTDFYGENPSRDNEQNKQACNEGIETINECLELLGYSIGHRNKTIAPDPHSVFSNPKEIEDFIAVRTLYGLEGDLFPAALVNVFTKLKIQEEVRATTMSKKETIAPQRSRIKDIRAQKAAADTLEKETTAIVSTSNSDVARASLENLSYDLPVDKIALFDDKNGGFCPSCGIIKRRQSAPHTTHIIHKSNQFSFFDTKVAKHITPSLAKNPSAWLKSIQKSEKFTPQEKTAAAKTVTAFDHLQDPSLKNDVKTALDLIKLACFDWACKIQTGTIQEVYKTLKR